MNLQLFFERLKAERIHFGFNQDEMAEKVGVSKRSYCAYEAGETAPSAKLLSALADMGVDVNYILTGQRSSAAPAPAPALTADEREMLALFKSATLTGKAAAIGALQGAAGASHTSKIHIAGGAHHGQIADVIHNTTTRTPARPRRS